jgi:general secretion pathway protein J
MTDVRSHREDGFTLLEMLVALSLMAVIGLYLSSAVGTGRRAWELRDRIEDASSTATVREFLRRQVEQAWPAYERTDIGEQRLVFSGEPDRIEFVSPISDGTNWGGLYRFVISKAKSETTLRIVGDLHRSSTEKSAAAFDTTILESVQSFKISYYGSASPNAKPEWHDNWNSIAGLPQLVRMEIGMAPESTVAWPDLIVSLALRSP